MHVNVVTPGKSFFDGDATELVLPAFDGEMGILPNHCPMIARLGHGVARITQEGGGVEQVAVYGGFVKVQDNVVSVLAGGAAARGEDDDSAKAASDYEDAKKALIDAKSEGKSATDIAAAEETLNRARAYHSLLKG